MHLSQNTQNNKGCHTKWCGTFYSENTLRNSGCEQLSKFIQLRHATKQNQSVVIIYLIKLV